MANRTIKSIESAEAYVAGLGQMGNEFLKETRRTHNRSIRGFRLPMGTASKAASDREKRIKGFAKLYGWTPPKDEEVNFY